MTSTAGWSLTQRALERLLERLGSDRDTAGQTYQGLRNRLVDYFDWKGALRPEDAADETLDRVARRLEDGERIEHVQAYAYGVARLVLLEHLRQQLRERRAPAAVFPDTAEPDDEEERIAGLMQCLQHLSADDRGLIVAYYEGAGRSHLKGRKLLAVRLGIPYTTLRTRAHRLRIRLEECLRRRLVGSP